MTRSYAADAARELRYILCALGLLDHDDVTGHLEAALRDGSSFVAQVTAETLNKIKHEIRALVEENKRVIRHKVDPAEPCQTANRGPGQPAWCYVHGIDTDTEKCHRYQPRIDAPRPYPVGHHWTRKDYGFTVTDVRWSDKHGGRWFYSVARTWRNSKADTINLPHSSIKED
jgi:hypothetical protein